MEGKATKEFKRRMEGCAVKKWKEIRKKNE